MVQDPFWISLHLCQRLHRVPSEWKREGSDAHSKLAATRRKAMMVLLLAGTLPHSTVQGMAEAAVRTQHSSHQGAKPDQHPRRPCGNQLLAGKLQKNPTLEAEGASGKGQNTQLTSHYTCTKRQAPAKQLSNNHTSPHCKAGIAAGAAGQDLSASRAAAAALSLDL